MTEYIAYASLAVPQVIREERPTSSQRHTTGRRIRTAPGTALDRSVKTAYGTAQSLIWQAREQLLANLSWKDQECVRTMPLHAVSDDADVLLVVLDQLRTLLQADGVALATIEDERNELVIEYATGLWADMRGNCIPTGNDISTCLPVVLSHIASVPLMIHTTTIGVLCVGRESALTEDNVRVLTAMGHIAANALYERHRTYLERQETYDTTLEGWVHALELRDHETKEHARRVTEMTVELARALGVSERDLVHVRRGALLHDIGKIAIPDSILLKPGGLTEREWQVMREHPCYAYTLLEPITFLQPALDIPYYHHEKWDGTGYPFGLQGEQIPLAARIFAVIDVWDALRFDRPYRAAWPEERVRRHITELAGTHFDPQIVQVFLSLLDEKPYIFSQESSSTLYPHWKHDYRYTLA